MDRYVSQYTSRLDAKGRVSVPAAFRAVLLRDGFEGLYVHQALTAEAVDCGGHALLREIDTLLSAYSSYSEEYDRFATVLHGTSEVLRIDGEGRIGLTESIKAHAHVTSEVTFVGLGQKFQIWEPGRFRAHLDEAKRQMRDLRRQLGARPTGAGEPSSNSPGARE